MPVVRLCQFGLKMPVGASFSVGLNGLNAAVIIQERHDRLPIDVSVQAVLVLLLELKQVQAC